METRSFALVGLGLAVGSVLSAGLVASACSSSSPSGASPFVDAGTDDTAMSDAPTLPGDGSALSAPFSPPGDPGPGAIYVTASGEANAITGYPFPPPDPSLDTYMVDGWQFVINEYIVNVDKVTLWSNPNLSPTNQSMHGAQVAHLDGPLVIDLKKGGPLTG